MALQPLFISGWEQLSAYEAQLGQGDVYRETEDNARRQTAHGTRPEAPRPIVPRTPCSTSAITATRQPVYWPAHHVMHSYYIS